jgi:FLVCR family MFS transporter
VYPSRWYILFVYSTVAFTQNLVWLSFSPITPPSKEYFGVGDGTIDLWLAWGPICFIPVVFLTSFLLNRDGGLRYTMKSGSVMCAVAACIRILAIIHPKEWYSIAIIHLAQIINACVGPFVMASPSKMSSNWFPPHERTTATALGLVNANLGAATGFLVAPYCVKYFNIQTFIIGEAIWTLIPLVLALIYFPDKPPTPPSAAAELKSVYFKKEIQMLIANPNAVFLITVAGWATGVWSVWTGMFDTFLSPLGFDETFSGWLGFIATIAGWFGGFSLGYLGDRLFKRRFKMLLLVIFFVYLMCTIWFVLSLPTPWSDKPILPDSRLSILFSAGCFGFFQGGFQPFLYEFSAELSFPVSEGTSVGLLVLINNASGIFFLIVQPYITGQVMNGIYLGSIILSFVLFFFVKERYPRSELDENKNHIIQ